MPDTHETHVNFRLGAVRRRRVLSGLAAFLATPALVRAEALRPMPRGGTRPEGLAEILAGSRLEERSGWVFSKASWKNEVSQCATAVRLFARSISSTSDARQGRGLPSISFLSQRLY